MLVVAVEVWPKPAVASTRITPANKIAEDKLSRQFLILDISFIAPDIQDWDGALRGTGLLDALFVVRFLVALFWRLWVTDGLCACLSS